MTDALLAAPEKNSLRRPAAPHTPIGVVVGAGFPPCLPHLAAPHLCRWGKRNR